MQKPVLIKIGSVIQLPTSVFQLRSSDFGLPTSDFGLPTSDLKHSIFSPAFPETPALPPPLRLPVGNGYYHFVLQDKLHTYPPAGS